MLEKSNYYPGQKSNEEIILFIRRHIAAYLKWIIIIFFMISIPLFIFIYMSIQGRFVVTEANKLFFIISISAYSLLIMAIFITTWIDWYLDVTIVTKEHLINIKQDELFSRSVAEQSLLRVQDVSSRMKGVLQTFFRFGTVYVETAGEQPNFRMIDIPKPHQVASMIMEIHEELIEEHELGEEITEGIGMDKVRPIKDKIPKIDEQIERVKKEHGATDKDDIIVLRPNGEEKIITIKQPQKTPKKQKKQSAQADSNIVKKISNSTNQEKNVDFNIEKTWIDNNTKKDSQRNSLARKQPIANVKQKDVFKVDKIEKIDGEIKEGEEIKF